MVAPTATLVQCPRLEQLVGAGISSRRQLSTTGEYSRGMFAANRQSDLAGPIWICVATRQQLHDNLE